MPPQCLVTCRKTRDLHAESNVLDRGSPSRDRGFDMGLEPRSLMHALVPAAQIGEFRALDRKREPAVDLRPKHDLGEGQPIAPQIGTAVELVVNDAPSREGPAARRL